MNLQQAATSSSPTGRHTDQSRPLKKNSNKPASAFISLSKLKNYIPKTDRLTGSSLSKLQQQLLSTPVESSGISIARVAEQRSFNYFRRKTPNYNCTSNDPRAVRSIRCTNLDDLCEKAAPRLTDHTHNQRTFAPASTAALNQVESIGAPQESEQPQKPSATANSNIYSGFAQESSKEVEPSGALDKYKATKNAAGQEHCIQRIDSDERKQKRTDILICSADSKRARSRSNDSSKYTSGCGRNNMTPSSLLLIQNNNCIARQPQQLQQQHQSATTEQQQQRGEEQTATADYNHYTLLSSENSNTNQAHRGSSGFEHIHRQVRESAKKSSDGRHCESTDTSATAGPTAVTTPATATLNRKLQSSSSSSYPSLMLTDTNHFIISSPSLDSNSSINTGSTNDNNNKITNLSTSKTTINETSTYSTSAAEDPSNHQAQNQQLINDHTDIRNQYIQQNYHQGPSVDDIRNNTVGKAQFVQYSAPNCNLLADQYYRSFQPFRLDHNSVASEQVDNSGNTSTDRDSTTRSNFNPGTDLTPALNFVHQQSRSPIKLDHYRSHSQYNLMPTHSSKSSSPHNLTPSPTNSMQTVSSSHNSSGQLLTGLNSVTSTMPAIEHPAHLHHSNQLYGSGINNSTVANLSNHHSNQLNQHHTYNQQPTSGTNQHHLNLPSQEQVYAHQHHQSQHHLQQQTNLNNQQQSIYHQIANGAVIAGGSINNTYSQSGNGMQYPAHMQTGAGSHQPSNLMVDAHQSHLNTAAAACAAAAVVSQTLKTVANQHNQHHSQHYGGHINNGFSATTGSLMNMTAQHHQQFHSNVTSMNQHHAASQGVGLQQQLQHHHHQTLSHPQQQHQPSQLQQSRSVNQTTSIVTRKYQCKMCPQVFMSKAEMKYHNQNHMREAKPYKCLQCPKAFANSSYLSQHMRIHQGVKPYTCDICSRKFTQLSHLQQHRRTHSGDKPYKCQYPNCTKQFSQLSNLQSHSRCHQLDKPYKCNSCYKCFHDEQGLLEHIPRHLESKHLKKNLCIFCGSSYQQERGLVKHFQQYHTDKAPTLVAAAIGAGTTGNTSLVASLISSSQAGVFATPSSGSTSSSSSTTSSVSSSSTNSISGGIGNGIGSNANLSGHNAPSGGYQLGSGVF